LVFRSIQDVESLGRLSQETLPWTFVGLLRLVSGIIICLVMDIKIKGTAFLDELVYLWILRLLEPFFSLILIRVSRNQNLFAYGY